MCRDTLPVCQVRYALTSLLLSPFYPSGSFLPLFAPLRPLSHPLCSVASPPVLRVFFRRCFVLVCTRSDTIRVDADEFLRPRGLRCSELCSTPVREISIEGIKEGNMETLPNFSHDLRISVIKRSRYFFSVKFSNYSFLVISPRNLLRN